jgi:hypothetical protein
MSEHERNEICIETHRRFDKHCEESVPFRNDVVKHTNQILTLEKAHENTMKDISDIKETLTEVQSDIKDLGGQIKLWVLSGIASTVVVFAIPTLALFYNAGQMSKQIDVNTKKWEALENRK